jgi:hypothetical protein
LRLDCKNLRNDSCGSLVTWPALRVLNDDEAPEVLLRSPIDDVDRLFAAAWVVCVDGVDVVVAVDVAVLFAVDV